MIEIDPAVVSFVILKSREFDVKVDPVAEESDSEDDQLAILENYADDPTFQEVHDFIEALNVSEQRNLVALMWIGRGDFSKEEWEDAVSEARDRATNSSADYLLGTPLLPDYLEEGMAAMGYAPEDLEKA